VSRPGEDQGRAPSLARGMGVFRRRGERWTRFAARIANAFGLVLLLVLVTYMLLSLTAYKGWTAVLVAMVVSLGGVVALVSAEAGPVLVGTSATLAAVSVVLAVVAAAGGGSAVLGTSALLLVVLLAVATVVILGAVISEREVGFRTILGAVSVYVNLGLLFTFLYSAIDRLQAGPFFGTKTETGDFVFFSITTLTTTGYGNLVPAAQPGKLLSGLEMLTGQLFLVTFIAGLVSLWRPGRALEKTRG
jgi:Ion channel